MAKESANQLNLTVVALVALVAIVGLVALVMNAASVQTPRIATGSGIVSAADDSTLNIAGDARRKMSSAECMDIWVYKGGLSSEKAASFCAILEK